MERKSIPRINVSSLYLLIIVVSLFSSCTGETNIIDGNNNKLLNFSVSVPSWKSNDPISSSKDSRATPIEDTSLGTSNTFNLIADENDGSGNYSTLIDNKPVSYSNNLWTTTTDYYWSGTSSKTINFYAYYPTSISTNITHTTAGTAPILDYTVPDDVAKQPDVIVATASAAGNTNAAATLSFNHIFAAVKFSVGTSGMPTGTITNVTLNNIQYIGTYPLGGTWTPNTTSLKSFSQTVSASNAANTVITSGATTFMMMPQTLNSNASITVTYSGGGTLTKAISGTWEAGKTYTYNVSKTIAVANFDYTGDVQTYTVPLTGTYKLEVWGAQGGGYAATIGYGGYSYGNIKLNQNQIIYICVGSNSGYNGGGSGAVSGGGATHMATMTGLLQSLYNNTSSVLIVAGGSGAVTDGEYAGSGGGTTGGDGGAFQGIGTAGKGGTQTYGGAAGSNGYGTGTAGGFGYGGSGIASDTGPGGGGGWYGGGGTPWAGGAGGGSGHLGVGLISGTTGMQNGVRSGNGYARITFVSAN